MIPNPGNPKLTSSGWRRHRDTPQELIHCFTGYFSLLFSYQIKSRSFNPNGWCICLSGRLLRVLGGTMEEQLSPDEWPRLADAIGAERLAGLRPR